MSSAVTERESAPAGPLAACEPGGAFKLRTVAMNYAWGRPAAESEVAALRRAAGEPVDAARPHAELWVGTHPSGPARLAEGPDAGTPLIALLRDRPELLGAAAPRFGADLPFLLKVLSVGTALSIQSHPDKALAERLHAARPNAYPDANHKPEMALALRGFEALCGFAPHAEAAAALTGVPELREAVGASAADAYAAAAEGAPRRAALRAAFSALMSADAARMRALVERLAARLAAAALAGAPLARRERLALRLHSQYPGDVGVLAAWLLNYVELAPGEALALGANEPHAYLAGELVECMAASDNVIRAGLTPKPRDVATLCASLTYAQGAPAVLRGAADAARALTLWRPPFAEFEVWRYAPADGGAPTALPPARGPLVALVGAGGAAMRAGGAPPRRVGRGEAFFVGAGTPLAFEGAEGGLVVWFAAPNSMGF
jgi:mannose-6-phosphate isomerase